MSKKKRNKNTGAGTPKPLVQLSQCMIVKDEERNIEKALSWGKGIVCEQIVVDTGSNDRTVEIAKRMGAKVLHFEWINDFASAKNFAIEQASGNWIAFLDADEYFPKEDAVKLLPILRQIMTDPGMKGKYLAVGCPMHQLSDEGKTMGVDVQVRLFRNMSAVRYVGRIHEELSIGAPDIVRTKDIKIMHTGYSKSSYDHTGKSTRNIEILRSELAKNPEDLRLKLYLADSLTSYANAVGTGGGAGAPHREAEAFHREAEALYKEVALGDADLDPEYKKTAYRFFLNKYSKTPETDPEYERICENALSDFSDDHKIMCLYAAVLNKKGEYGAAFELLKRCEANQSSAEGSFTYSIPDMTLMCTQMVYAAQGLGDTENMLGYTAAMLTADKTNTNVLSNYIRLLLRTLPSYESVLEMLAMVYDMSSDRDRALIAGAARECGAEGLVQGW